MKRSEMVPRALEAAWQGVLEAALDRVVPPRALAVMVERMSARYRGEPVALAPSDERAARALFWLPRDLPKVHRAVAELALADALPPRPLRVLDLGAGLGATSLGLLRALPPTREVTSVTAIDRDPQALALAARVFAGAADAGLIPQGTRLETLSRDLSEPAWREGLGAFDLVLAGLSLVELSREAAEGEAARGALIAAKAREMCELVAEDGAVILIEPGSREETRALHHARAHLLAAGLTVFSPCLTARSCPMLESARDWCHEDLAERSLPPWLVPTAKAAGLRWEGLTWSYLVLRRDGRALRDALAGEGLVPLRVVSNLIETKGKTEAWLCGDAPSEGALVRAMELAREAKRARGETLSSLERGALVRVPAEELAGEARRVARLAPGRWTSALE